MAKIDGSELDSKAKSNFGFYQPANENKYSKMFYQLFLKNTPFKTFINGSITAGVFVYWIFTKNSWLVFIWFFYIVIINLLGLAYWKIEENRINKELVRLDTELSKIKKEINDRQKYFKDLKAKIDKGEVSG